MASGELISYDFFKKTENLHDRIVVKISDYVVLAALPCIIHPVANVYRSSKTTYETGQNFVQ